MATIVTIDGIGKPSDVIPFFGLSQVAPENQGKVFTNSNLNILIASERNKIGNAIIDYGYKETFEENSDLYYLLKLLCIQGVAIEIWKSIGFSLVNRFTYTYSSFTKMHQAISAPFYAGLFERIFREEGSLVELANVNDVISVLPGYGKNSANASPSVSEVKEFIKYGSSLAIAICKLNGYKFETTSPGNRIYETLNGLVSAYARAIFVRARSYSSFSPEDSGALIGDLSVPFEVEVADSIIALTDPFGIPASFLRVNV